MEERRKYKRIKTRLLFSYSIQNYHGLKDKKLSPNGTAIITDITLAGAMITTSQCLPNDMKLCISMSSFFDLEIINIVGKVMWNRQIDESSFACGIMFVEYKDSSDILLEQYLTKIKKDFSSSLMKGSLR
ncbi:MAG: PilZ domain-containing protein [Pseudomonadota bacterium]